MHQAEWNQIAELVDFNLEVDLVRFCEEVPSEHNVLDFGCGYGRIGNLLRKSGYKNIVGIDASESMIERGKREFPELSLELVTGAALPFSDQSFDAVIACAVFTCITDHKIRRSQFGEICRILKPDGLLHMVEFCSDLSRFFTASIGVPMLHSSIQEFRDLTSPLHIVSEEVIKTNTMNGDAANSYSVFARKSLNKSSKKDALKRASS